MGSIAFDWVSVAAVLLQSLFENHFTWLLIVFSRTTVGKLWLLLCFSLPLSLRSYHATGKRFRKKLARTTPISKLQRCPTHFHAFSLNGFVGQSSSLNFDTRLSFLAILFAANISFYCVFTFCSFWTQAKKNRTNDVICGKYATQFCCVKIFAF